MLAHVTGKRHPPELDAFLASVPFFAALDETVRSQLARQFEPVHVAAGEVIIAQGEMGDGLFLVVSGRLRVLVTARGTERVLHDLGCGATVGEIALLSDRPRSATVRAVRDSELLLLRAPAFRSLAERNPAVLAAMARLLIDRLLAVDRPQETPPARHAIAVAAAGKGADAATMVAERLAAQLARAGPALYMDSGVVARHLGPGAAQRKPGDPGWAELIGWLHAVERSNRDVVYQTDAGDTAWTRLCLGQSDVVLLAAAANDDPSPGPVEVRALATDSLRCELVLVEPGKPSATAKWLKHRPVAAFHHVCEGRPQDVARLARLVTGTGCGLVLGGGGPRGFAHLGVLRALEEAGVPIDAVGGTSIGAVMGALYALGMDHAERVERAVTAFTRSGRLVSPTLPLVALSSGRRVDRLLAEHFGSVNLEDLPLGFFCVSASLTRAEEVIHERGPLWPAVRASLSLPGILPPVYAAGDLLVDGAALNDLPTDVMRERLGSGCVVAVDLSPDVEPLNTAPFEDGLPGWQVLKTRLNPLGTVRPATNVVDILSRSTGLSQIRQRRAALAGDGIDLLLHPPIAALGALDFNGGVALIEAGYRYAADALAKSKLADRFVT
jgi:predicted acylesterase/phospholipase RssA/CRP-like cAMP-binding protein